MKNDFRQNFAAVFSAVMAGGVFVFLLFVVEWFILFDVLIAAGTYVALYLMLKPQLRIGNTKIEFIEGGEELEKKLLEAKDDYDSISRHVKKINDLRVREEAEKLVATASSIIEYLENNPEKIRHARQFIDYYQESASDILEKYITLQDANIETSEIIKLKKDTENALVTLNTAFKEQFEKLIRGEIIDMQAEFALLEQTVKTENDLYKKINEQE